MLKKIVAANQKLNPKLRQIIGNTGWLFSEKLLQMGLGLVVGVWVARYLGPTQFGLFSYALSFTALFSPLAKLGLDRIVVRDIVQNPSDRQTILGTAFMLKLISGIMSYLLAVVTISLLRPSDNLTRALVEVIGCGIYFQVFYTIDLWFQSQVESKYTVWSKNTAYILINIVKVILIKLQAPVIFFAWNALAEVVLGSIGLLIAYKLKGHEITGWRINIKKVKDLLNNALPLMFSGMAVMVYLRVDAIMLGQMFGDKSVGIYSVATRISELWYFIPGTVVSSVSPAILESKSVAETLYERRLQKLFTLLAGIAYAIAIPMTILATPIVVIMYGQDYIASGSILAIHIWAGVFVFLGIAKGVWIVAEGLTRFALISTLCGAIINVLLNIVMIPKYREVGAAIATVISYGCADYLVYITYPRFRKLGIIMTKALILKSLWSR